MPSLKRHIISSTFFLFASNNLQKAISFFVFLFLVRTLSLVDYGVLTLLFSLPGPTLMLISLGVEDVILSEVAAARGKNDTSKIKSILLGYLKSSFWLFCLVFFISYLFRGYLAAHYNIYLLQYYFPVIIFVSGQCLANYITNFLKSHEEFLKISILSTFEPVFRLLSLIIFFYFFTIDVRITFLIYAFSKWFVFFLGTILSLSLFKKTIAAKSQVENEFLKILKSSGKWAIFRNLLDQVTNNFQPWLIKIYLNTEAVALYGFAGKIYSFLTNFIPIQQVLLPVVSRYMEDKKKISLVIQKVTKYHFLFSSITVILLWLFSRFVIGLIAPQYLAAVLLVNLLSFRLFLDSMSIGHTSIFYAYKKQKLLFWIYLYASIQSVAITWFFLYYFGLVGLIVGYLIHIFLIVLVRIFFIKKYIGILNFKIRDFFKYDEYDKMIVERIKSKAKSFFLFYKKT
jgi:O-antigen/teichoic acid export membrane protein